MLLKSIGILFSVPVLHIIYSLYNRVDVNISKTSFFKRISHGVRFLSITNLVYIANTDYQ